MSLIRKKRQLGQIPRWRRRSFLETRDDAADSVQCVEVLEMYWMVCATGFSGCCESSSCEECEVIGSIDLSSTTTTTTTKTSTSYKDATTTSTSVTTSRSFEWHLETHTSGGSSTSTPGSITTSPSKTSDSTGGITTSVITSVNTINGVAVTSTSYHTVTATANADKSNSSSSTSTVTATANADKSNSSSSTSSDIALPIGIAIGAVLFVALLIAFFLLCRKRKQKRRQSMALLSAAPETPIPKEGFFKSLKDRFSVGITSPQLPAYVENDTGPVSPAMGELLGDVEHTPELPSGDDPSELPSSPREGSDGGNEVGLGVGMRGGERNVQELGLHEAPTRPSSRKEDLSGDGMKTRQGEELGPQETPSAPKEGENGKGAADGTLANSQSHAGHVLSFMQYEGGAGGRASGETRLG
jgi:hypothetical protein